MPTSEAMRMVAHSFSGPVMYCWLKLMMALPRPSPTPPGPSPMMAPMMAHVAATLSAVKRNGTEAGKRSLR